MHNHNIIYLLRKFSITELKRLEIFLNSPYHNRSKKIIKLFNVIKKFHPGFTNKKLTKEYLSKIINPGIAYKDSTMRDLMSTLLACVEEFLCLEELNKSNSDKDIYLLRSLVEKNQEGLFNKHLEKLDKKLDAEGIDSVYFYKKSLIEVNKINFSIINLHQRSSSVIENSNQILISYMIYIINYCVTELINSYIKIMIIGSKFKINGQNTPLEIIECINLKGILNLLNKTGKDNYILEIYLNLFFAFQNIDDPAYYIKYKSLFMKHFKSLSKDEISYHFSMLISYSMLNNSIPGNNYSYDKELFQIHEIYLKNKIFIDKKSKYIDEDLYRNILHIALRLNEYSWIFNFIKNYSKFLHPDKRENLDNLSFAEYYYHIGKNSKSKKDFKRAYNYLVKIKEESFIVKYDVKSLYLMLYSDLKNDGNIETQINNYREFLKRNKLVTDSRRKKINIFLNLFEKLVFLKNGDPKIDISDLNFELLNNKDIDHRQWVLDKIKEIENRV